MATGQRCVGFLVAVSHRVWSLFDATVTLCAGADIPI